MAKKKLLFIVKVMDDGVFTYIVDLTNELVESFDMYVAHKTRPRTPADYKDYFNKRIHLIKVKNFTKSISPVLDVKAFFEIKQIAKDVKPDIIHLHSSKAGALGRFVFNGKKVPLHYTPHEYSFLMQNQGEAKRAIYKAVETVCAKRSCTTISCSLGEHQETLKLTKRAKYVNNGINTGELDKVIKKIQVADHPFTVFTLDHICYQENPELLNKIALAMLLWIGDGEMRESLAASNITITGWADRVEASRLSMNADLFLLTSLWEGLPISLLEAMYMEKLCVFNDAIGNHDVIENGRNGFVCRTVEEFFKGIKSDNRLLIDQARKDDEAEYNTVVMARSTPKAMRYLVFIVICECRCSSAAACEKAVAA